MHLIAITTCTNRKRFPVPARLTASALSHGPLPAVAAQWRERVSAAETRASATDVYSGRGFREACLAAKAGEADLLIISGGLGLVRGGDSIPSYGLALVQGSPE